VAVDQLVGDGHDLGVHAVLMRQRHDGVRVRLGQGSSDKARLVSGQLDG
jgi:hypothetical protein